MSTTRTIEIETYKFSELSGKAKDKARTWLIEGANMHEWWDFVYEDRKTKLAERGFPDAEIMFSGFSSQGDGACFTCKRIDIEKWIKFHKLGNEYRHVLKAAKDGELGARITHSGNYYHQETMRLESDSNYIDDEALDQWNDHVYDAIAGDMKSLARQIYAALGDEYDHITSDESLNETAEANEYEFTKEGSRCVPL